MRKESSFETTRFMTTWPWTVLCMRQYLSFCPAVRAEWLVHRWPDTAVRCVGTVPRVGAPPAGEGGISPSPGPGGGSAARDCEKSCQFCTFAPIPRSNLIVHVWGGSGQGVLFQMV